jgi:membrane-associated phospholipid phosphatase
VATALLLCVPPGHLTAAADGIEPQAGTWQTWVLTSGAQFRLPPPPDQPTSAGEIAQLKSLATQRDDAARAKIAFWDSGAPGYRWDAVARDELVKHGVTTASATTTRALALVDVAIYDATVAAWDSKYTYNRPRPSDADPTLETVIPNPASPAYPSEHAVVAGAASAVLAYLYPDDSDALAAMASEAGESRELAGVQYPSDTAAGADLGHNVADRVIDRARNDGSQLPWTGSIPSDPNLWNLDGYPPGTQPVAPTFGSLKTWVLESGKQLRPGPPPAPDSERKQAELAELKDFPPTFPTNAAAFYWQSTRSVWPLVAERELFEAHLDRNPPRAARVAALVNIAGFDATVACWDAKYTYWARRPFQLDADVRPLFQTPAHPSYPSAHGCLSGAQSGVLGALFPADAAYLSAQADEAAMSRIWAGIHFRSDVEVGLELGRAVANLVMQHADGG